ncbi:penicillin-binding protein [Alteribacter keqinensis]|uniref:serine-type D-Ala-D-Ala carboxypeptidase n=1 Tax=Alteribacter keqinensis TaxID=2483800 RepID=A0A3M7TXR9_9BACI|nr:penicillin-binding protein [Alteribacter keqinensis]RNA69692.1 penicillin-binding protein [Alteribacter keqinensis]
MEVTKNRKITVRALWVLGIFLFFISIVFGRFVYIQAAKEVQGQDLRALIEQRWSQTHTIEGKRGSILDREGEAIAEEVASYTLIAVLDDSYGSYVSDPQEAAAKITSVLDLDTNAVAERLSQDLVQVEIPGARYLSVEEKDALEELEIDGIIFRKDPKRYYPNQTFASHLIGYTERDMSVARMGLEQSLDEYLSSEDGSITYQRDGAGRALVNTEDLINPARNGNDVYLTIDKKIQMVLEQALSQVDEEYSPERMIGIVADPKTGEILAMSNRPSFNPNNYESISNYTNYAVSSRFEPGSTIKALTLAAAIEEGVYNGDELYQSGTYQIGPDRIPDHNGGRGWGEITYDEGFQRSSNVAFSKLALEKLTPDTFFDYVDAFGLREPTGIDIPNESGSSIADFRPIDAATTAFGQGSAITPIQQVQAATAIANGGKMMKPYVIDKIYDKDSGEIVSETEPEVVGEPISEETAAEVLGLLETVVSSSAGTGQPYAIDGFDIAGKTGTAQINNPDGPGRLTGHGNHIYSFMGMAPADDPEVIVYVAVERPDIELHETGAMPVSKVFKPVMQQSLQYLNITPQSVEEEHVEEAGIVMEDFSGESVEKTEETLKNYGLDPVIIGEGNTVISQFPNPEMSILPYEKVFMRTNEEEFLIPDMSGWSGRQVHAWTRLADMEVTIDGSGFVISQSVPAGTEVTSGQNLSVELGSGDEPAAEQGDTGDETEYETEEENEESAGEEETEETEEDEVEEDEFFMD